MRTEEFYAKIRYHSKNVSYSKTPFNHVASIKCPLYHRLPKNASLVEKVAAEVQCAACKRLVHDLRQLVAKKATVSPKRKASWTQPSSRYKMKYLSPASLKKRKQLIKQERTRDKRIVERYSSMMRYVVSLLQSKIPTRMSWKRCLPKLIVKE